MGEICSFNERNDRYKGNLLKGLETKCSSTSNWEIRLDENRMCLGILMACDWFPQLQMTQPILADSSGAMIAPERSM